MMLPYQGGPLKQRKEPKTLRRLRQQAARTRHAHGITVTVDPGRMALRIGPVKFWFPGYTVTVRSPNRLPSVARRRTATGCSNILRGISLHSLHTGGS